MRTENCSTSQTIIYLSSLSTTQQLHSLVHLLLFLSLRLRNLFFRWRDNGTSKLLYIDIKTHSSFIFKNLFTIPFFWSCLFPLRQMRNMLFTKLIRILWLWVLWITWRGVFLDLNRRLILKSRVKSNNVWLLGLNGRLLITLTGSIRLVHVFDLLLLKMLYLSDFLLLF